MTDLEIIAMGFAVAVACVCVGIAAALLVDVAERHWRHR